MMRNVLILGAAGNVGRGLTEAFYRNGWNVYAVDPNFSSSSSLANNDESTSPKLLFNWNNERQRGETNVHNDLGQLHFFSSTVEKLFESTTIWDDLFHQETQDDDDTNYKKNDIGSTTRRKGKIKDDDNPTIITICYAAENGNRDDYASIPNDITEQNIQQFSTFIHKLSHVIQEEEKKKKKRHLNENDSNNNNDTNNVTTMPTTVRIFYCGGSWTRRQPTIFNNDNDDTSSIVVNDDSPTKKNGGDNPYERAKTLSYWNAKALAKQHQDWCDICFIDYISVVPNFSPNFTIYKMVQSAIQDQKIIYSHGDDYGRPLLHTRDAGQIIATLASKEKLMPSTTTTTTTTDDENDENISTEESGGTSSFRLVLLPGHFTPFEKFASIVKDVVTNETNIDQIRLEKQNSTPDFLRSKCMSKQLYNKIGFQPNESLIEDALIECAMEAVKNSMHKKL